MEKAWLHITKPFQSTAFQQLCITLLTLVLRQQHGCWLVNALYSCHWRLTVALRPNHAYHVRGPKYLARSHTAPVSIRFTVWTIPACTFINIYNVLFSQQKVLYHVHWPIYMLAWNLSIRKTGSRDNGAHTLWRLGTSIWYLISNNDEL